MGRQHVGYIHEEIRDVFSIFQRLHFESKQVTIEGLATNGIHHFRSMRLNGGHQFGQLRSGRHVVVHHRLVKSETQAWEKGKTMKFLNGENTCGSNAESPSKAIVQQCSNTAERPSI